MEYLALISVGVCAILLIAIDIYLAIKGGARVTISAKLYEASKEYPVIALIIGFIIGHIFW